MCDDNQILFMRLLNKNPFLSKSLILNSKKISNFAHYIMFISHGQCK